MISPPTDVASLRPRDGREPDATLSGARRRPSALQLIAAAAGLAGLVWVVVALVTAGRGFDITDEGYYLLSYRWWDTNLYTYTGAQYFYGPIFELLGYNIAGLRVFRLLTVVATHAAFGWSFMTWLRTRRPAAPATRWWELAGTAAIAATGGMVYSWLPLSPGYNDISLLGALLAAAAALRIARGPAPLWVPALLGPLAVVMLLAKWSSSVLTLLVVVAVIVVTARRRGWRELLRLAAAGLGGAVLALAFIHLVLVPLTDALPMMLRINKLVAAATNDPTALLRLYLDNLVLLGKQVVKGHGVLLLAAAIAPFARTRSWRWVAFGLAGIGLALSIWRAVANQELLGGTIHLERFPNVIAAALSVIGVLTVAFLVANRVRRPAEGEQNSLTRKDWSGWLVLAMLAALPFTQAAGTGNPVHFLAITGLAAWVALGVALVTGMETASMPARALGLGALGAAVLATMAIAATGLWQYPYRTAPHAETTVEVAGAPAISSIRLDAETAAKYADLRSLLNPYLDPPGRAIMAFDEMPGLVLLLDGRPVGEAWYSAIDNQRTAASIERECAASPPWWGERAPLLIFHRPVTEIERSALRSCGLPFETAYRQLVPSEQAHGLLIYVPSGELKER